MLKKDIVINGVSVNGLKQQRDAIRQEANKIVSDNIDAAQNLIGTLKEQEDADALIAVCKEIYELLDTAQILSGIADISFLLPYKEEYGGYDSDEVLSSILEDGRYDDEDFEAIIDTAENKSDIISKLCSLAYSMESDSRGWHSSTC